MEKRDARKPIHVTASLRQLIGGSGASLIKNIKSLFSRASKHISRFIHYDSSGMALTEQNKVMPLDSVQRTQPQLKESCTGELEKIDSGNLDLVKADGCLDANLFSKDTVGQPQHGLAEPIIRLNTNKRCLVLDLDETLIHSSFNIPVSNADFILDLNLSENYIDRIYVSKRPFLDEFLQIVSKYYEVVLFTASLPTYANPVIDMIDPEGKYFHHKLFRQSCLFFRGHFVKDLSIIGKPLSNIIIVDNSPISYILQPKNALAIPTWYSDPEDRCLELLSAELIKLSVPSQSLATLEDINELLQEEAGKRVSSLFPSNIAAILAMVTTATEAREDQQMVAEKN